ncbi:LacI family transcriptional regulator [Nakamurella antarctica]|uniref:LacI family transcriptional regulator n=1 Tax=Nakamurella antarctica TaxID=1902245 RepID=A0A3G8ZX84_9ACTN|nr:LacI family DNA-binding transcriptional regulator [Nakamurella antarctica]AZI58636.1 LacI family transcriptional regulator [Nakamurella antarctica]
MATIKRRATIIDVARVAGVSRQTVTRALNGLPDVSPATRARVVDTARSLRYRPNRAAQGLVHGGGVTVGLVVEDLRNPYFPELASALSRIATDRGWSLVLCDIGAEEGRARLSLAALVHRVDALLLTGCRTDTVALLPPEALRGVGLGIPLVMLDGEESPHLDAVVRIDNRTGVYAALSHLRDIGRRRIGFIGSLLGSSLRNDLYRSFLTENGLEWSEQSQVVVEETHQGGIDGAEQLIAQYPEMDAVLVYNDVMAIGALKGFQHTKVEVPARIAVIGFDGLDIGSLVSPELTTLSIDKSEIARHAIELVSNILDGTATPDDGSREVGLSLILRGSA